VTENINEAMRGYRNKEIKVAVDVKSDIIQDDYSGGLGPKGSNLKVRIT
jgi:hypothetical protein